MPPSVPSSTGVSSHHTAGSPSPLPGASSGTSRTFTPASPSRLRTQNPQSSSQQAASSRSSSSIGTKGWTPAPPPSKQTWNSSTAPSSQLKFKPPLPNTAQTKYQAQSPLRSSINHFPGHPPIPKRGFPSTSSNASTTSGASHHPSPPRGRNFQMGLRAKYETLLGTSNKTERDLRESLRKLRKLILSDGLPELDNTLTTHTGPGRPRSCAPPSPVHNLRSQIWKILLGVYRISISEYMSLVAKRESDVYDKIQNDTFRTLATDERFLEKVEEVTMIRVLNAFAWKAKEFPTSHLLSLRFSYVQGMNVLLAPIIYVMPSELDAFFAFTNFIQNNCPLYVQPSLEGAHCGLKLLDICLATLDPTLHQHLKSKGLSVQTFAMPLVLTFSACVQPLDEVLRLWDFLLAWGVHFNILCIVAQMIMMREDLLADESPGRRLRTFPALRARLCVEMVVHRLLPGIDESLFDQLVRHPYDPEVLFQLELK